MMSRPGKASSLASGLQRMTKEQLRDLVSVICQYDTVMRSKVLQYMNVLFAQEEKMKAKAAMATAHLSSEEQAEDEADAPGQYRSPYEVAEDDGRPASPPSPPAKAPSPSRRPNSSYFSPGSSLDAYTPPRVRASSFSSRSPSPGKGDEARPKRPQSSLFERLPPSQTRLIAHRNINPRRPVTLVAKTFQDFLNQCTVKLDLAVPARKLYNSSGREVHDLSEVKTGSDVYVSVGEPFQDPKSWSAPVLTKTDPHMTDGHRLVRTPAKLFKALRNGDYRYVEAVNIIGDTIDELLMNATLKLSMPTPAKDAYMIDGRRLVEAPGSAAVEEGTVNFRDVMTGQYVFFASGEAFKPSPAEQAHNRQITVPTSLNARLQPQLAKWLMVMRNGGEGRDGALRINGSDLKMFLHLATLKMGLPSVAKKFYTEDGRRIVHAVRSLSRLDESTDENGDPGTATEAYEVAFADVPSGTYVFVSCGENYKNPQDSKRPPSPVKPLPLDSRLAARHQRRLMVLKNGETLVREGVYVVGTCVHEMLLESQEKLNLQGHARKFYTQDGRVVVDTLEKGIVLPSSFKAARQSSASPKKQHVYHEETIMPGPTKEAKRPATAASPGAPGASAGTAHNDEAGGSAETHVPLGQVEDGTVVWVSCGEAFKHANEAPADARARVPIPAIPADSRLIVRGKVRVMAFRNGWYLAGQGRLIVGKTLHELAAQAETVLRMGGHVRAFYTTDGVLVDKVTSLQRDQEVIATRGEPLQPLGVPAKAEPPSSPAKEAAPSPSTSRHSMKDKDLERTKGRLPELERDEPLTSSSQRLAASLNQSSGTPRVGAAAGVANTGTPNSGTPRASPSAVGVQTNSTPRANAVSPATSPTPARVLPKSREGSGVSLRDGSH